MRARLYVLGLVLWNGCGDDGGGPMYTPRPDASVDAMEPCKGAAEYSPGAFAADVQEATDYPREGTGEDATLHEIFFLAPLDNDDPGDYLHIDLYEMFGAFEGGDIKTGTFAIMGDDVAYSTCGACIMVAADVSADGTVDDWYVAQSGVLNLTSVTGRFTGSLSNVKLYRVHTDADGNPSDMLTFDCETRITSASFDTELLAPAPM